MLWPSCRRVQSIALAIYRTASANYVRDNLAENSRRAYLSDLAQLDA